MVAAEEARRLGLRFIAWSRIWSPLVPETLRDDAWQVLELPDCWSQHEPEFWQTFHVGVPAPPLPLLFHAVLGVPGDVAREEWLRVMTHLGLTWESQRLPPDHLGPACEILACAIEAEDSVLIDELCERYFLAWCRVGRERLAAAQSAMAWLPERFEADVRGLCPADGSTPG